MGAIRFRQDTLQEAEASFLAAARSDPGCWA
eukprot:CAMPEP_0169477860 /NCGR_PEP_ID=MMETSP1042-20121227/28157_1 /TAXON_ID=464988 /ORGANISM="Hemiselmis andersenii, Strain CCMP1180" /LENGTH=30 /DNA_ID= /DNA_START= /DNA_END= /DNA_ORIENTATION=